MDNQRINAVIVDMDGTLVDVSSVRHHVTTLPKDFDAFHAGSEHCPPHWDTIQWCIERHRMGDTLLVVTGRMDRWYMLSNTWLQREARVHFPYVGPFMRRDGDIRSDVVVKKEIHRYLSRTYNIRAARDDNPDIIGLWIKLGIPVSIQPGWDNDHPRQK